MDRRMTDHERRRKAKEHWSWIGMIIEHIAYGFIAGALIVWLLIQYDVYGIGTMIANSEQRIGVTALLMFAVGHTLGMISAGVAIWLRALSRDEG